MILAYRCACENVGLVVLHVCIVVVLYSCVSCVYSCSFACATCTFCVCYVSVTCVVDALHSTSKFLNQKLRSKERVLDVTIIDAQFPMDSFQNHYNSCTQ